MFKNIFNDGTFPERRGSNGQHQSYIYIFLNGLY